MDAAAGIRHLFRMAIEPPTQAHEDPEWWQATLTQAWLDSRMEADRTLVALSTGGAGLIVTLLTAAEAPPEGVLWLYIVALVSFTGAIGAGVAIFRKNSEYLHAVLKTPETVDDSEVLAWLRELDIILIALFVIGVGLAAVGGVANAMNRSAERETRPVMEAVNAEQEQQPANAVEAGTGADRDAQPGRYSPSAADGPAGQQPQPGGGAGESDRGASGHR